FAPDGRKTLCLDTDPDLRPREPFSVRWRDAATGKDLGLLCQVPWANLLAFSRDGKRVALAEGDDGRIGVSVWDVASGKRLFRSLQPGDRAMFCLVFSPDGKKLAAGTWNADRPNFHL